MAGYVCECGRFCGIWATRCYICQEQDRFWGHAPEWPPEAPTNEAARQVAAWAKPTKRRPKAQGETA